MTEQAEQEIRDLFAAWFDASSRKDLDASMAPIAENIVSYEHEAPLQYRSVDDIRAVCARGFEAMPGQFRWDIPDLHVIVRGDIAVTWGLNRMRAEQPDRPAFESFSRGTRVFQKVDGRWRMIHQHVSFPYDPATGNVKSDLRP